MTKPQQLKPLTEDEVLLRMLKTKPKPHKAPTPTKTSSTKPKEKQ